MSESAIEWTDVTWNPVTGCDRVSPGCAHCYALELAPRLRRMAKADGAWADAPDGGPSSGPAFGIKLHRDRLTQPFRWRKPRRVFVNSMSDLFHEEVPDFFIAEVFAVMACNPQHTFQVLTKRPERMRDLLCDDNGFVTTVSEEATAWTHPDDSALITDAAYNAIPALPNVWLGVSIENHRFVHRADLLRQTPAAVRFISAEPLLGPLIAPRIVGGLERKTGAPGRGAYCLWLGRPMAPELNLTAIDWLIVGGESGPKNRTMRPEWVRDLRDAAGLNGVPFFFKQWGGRTPKAGGRELDGRTWDEHPGIGTPDLDRPVAEQLLEARAAVPA